MSIFSTEAILRLKEGLAQLGIPYSDAQIEKLVHYWEAVEQVNKSLNLTRVTGDEAITHHFLDSAAVISYIPKDLTLVDIGTGLGVPGLIIAILRPDLRITLLDSLEKRILFLRETIDLLKLENVTAIHGRAEYIAHTDDLREQFDIAISRAVTALPALIEISSPFLKVGGTFLAMKGPKVIEELVGSEKISASLGLGGLEKIAIQVPFLNESRFLITAAKVSICDPKFPRKTNRLGF